MYLALSIAWGVIATANAFLGGMRCERGEWDGAVISLFMALTGLALCILYGMKG